MRDYGKLYSTFWTSDTTRDLSDRGKLLALYLLLGPHSNMIGCFRLPDGYVMDDLGWDRGTVSKGFEELFRKGFATRDDSSKWVFIKRYLKWNPIENPNQGKAAIRLFQTIPDSFDGKLLLANELRDFGKRVDQTVLEPFRNGSGTLSKPVSGTGTGTGAGIEEGTEPETTTTKQPRFTPPSVEEVAAYCAERKSRIDPQRFVDYYAANGWRVGKNPMRDWKAAVRTWEKNEQERVTKRPTQRNPDQHMIDTINEAMR